MAYALRTSSEEVVTQVLFCIIHLYLPCNNILLFKYWKAK